MLENNGGVIQLQSIVGKFAEVQLNKRRNLSFFYKSALEYNMLLMASLAFIKRERKRLALKIFDSLKGNLFKSIHYCKEVDIDDDELMEYFEYISLFSIDTSSTRIYFDNLSSIAYQFKGEHKRCVNSVLLRKRYYAGEFKSSYEQLKIEYPIDSIFGLNYYKKTSERIIYRVASNIYEMEGEKLLDFVEYETKNSIGSVDYPTMLYRLGEFNLDLLMSVKPPLHVALVVSNALDILTVAEIDDYIAKIYEKDHIEIVQVSYLRSKLKPLDKKQIEKLVNVNPYTRGLKKLMLAFIEEDTSITNQLYQDAIEDLEHIKYYCVEAQYLYAKFLQRSGSGEFDNVYQKGLALSQKHHYRYLQYCFDTLLNPDIGPYDTKNYPLPNNEDFSEYIQLLIKKNQKR